ncbi:uncharacterized protein LOC141691358 [Apium graveolens]|uniref:uncharacterized protein LOC141691358 n=1 Tax=Apium graveolens TaxID=4045 RepID=UPI003D79E5E0
MEDYTYRVPGKLRETKHGAYTPQMVSIGPFHKQKAEFHAMEELKWLYMLAFVDRAKMQTKEFSALYVCGKNILEVEEKARAWYAEDIDLDKHQFVEMLLIDGCFILELFYRCKKINTQKFEDEFLQGPPESRVPFESPAGNFTMVQTLKHDLMLLENQIPDFVLQKLFDLVSSPNTTSDGSGTNPHMSLEDYVFWFFNSVPMLRLNYLKAPKNKKDEYTVSEQAQGNQQAQGKQQAHDKVNKDALIAGDFFCVSSRFLQGVSIANHVFDKISTPERSYAAATSGSLTASVIDANHPYYLHPSDNTGMLLTTVVLNSRTTHSGINP